MRQAKRPYLIVLLLAAQSLPGVAQADEVPARGAATGGIDSGSQPIVPAQGAPDPVQGSREKAEASECPRRALR